MFDKLNPEICKTCNIIDNDIITYYFLISLTLLILTLILKKLNKNNFYINIIKSICNILNIIIICILLYCLFKYKKPTKFTNIILIFNMIMIYLLM